MLFTFMSAIVKHPREPEIDLMSFMRRRKRENKELMAVMCSNVIALISTRVQFTFFYFPLFHLFPHVFPR